MSALPIVSPAPITSRMVDVRGLELPLRAAHVTAEAAAGLAVVTITQLFANTSAVPLEVTYQLPLPADAAVGGFAITVGDRRVVGQVRRREEARATYEQALFEGRTAGLLEQERAGLFTQSVGNVPPGAEVAVEVTIDQPLAWEQGGWCWRFPTVVAPRYVDAGTPDTDKLAVDVAERPLPARLSLGLQIGDALTGAPTSSSHVLDMQGGQVALGGGRARLDRDVVVRWPVAAQAPGVQAWWGEVDGEGFGSLVLVPPTVARASVARDLIVLLDVSGSMGGAPLAQAVKVVKRLVHSLGEGDSLELIAFGGTVWSWKPAAVRCSAAERAKAVAWLDTLRASGGTPMDEGIARALAGLRPEAQRQILLVTDGHIGFEQRIVGMIANGLGSSSRLHTLGVGGSTNRTLLRGAARVGRGIEAIVEPGDDVGPVLERVLRHLDRPQVVDLRLEGEAEVSPRQLPDLFAEAPARIAVKTKATRLRLVGRTAEGEWSQEIVVPTTREVRPALARLWAREAVEDAVTDGTLGQEVDGRIEALGLAWGIATRRTSFVAVSEEVTVDPTSPGRTVKVAHELPHELSAEGLGLRAVLPEVFGMSAPAAFAMPGSAPMPRMAPAPSTSGARGGAPSMRSAPKSRARDEMRESAPPTVFVQTSEEPPAPPSEAERADGMISRVWKRLRGQPSGPARPVRTLKARRVQPLGVDLGVDVQLDLATAWSLPAEVTVRLTDGRTVTCKLDVARSTRSGHLEAGAVLRLVLIGGAAARGDWRALVLDGLVVEL